MSNATIVNFLFVPLRYLQFLKIVRSTAAAAENEPSKVGPAPGPELPARRVPRPGRCDQPGSARNGAPALKPPHDAGTTAPPLGWHMIRATSKIGRSIPDLAKICKITEYIIPYHEFVQICWILELIHRMLTLAEIPGNCNLGC